MENERFKIGNIDIHLGNAKMLTKEQFSLHYRFSIGMDINEAWDTLQKEIKKNGGTKETSNKSNEVKHFGANEANSSKSKLQE